MSVQDLDPGLESLIAFIRDERGLDFEGYKRPSLTRRISKRMQEVGAASFGDYQALLADDAGEFASLFDAILVNVTSFFRDLDAWETISMQVVPRILDAHSADAPIRLWSTGCSTGEEALTLAMVFAEAMGADDFKRRATIYATDVDDAALDAGRRAAYSQAQLEPVPLELRQRYFEESNGSFFFRSDLRRSVIFGRNDLVQDPPISRIDLLVSRNTLMYFDAEAQRQILANFHFALRDGGVLFLGKSELLAAHSPLFAAVDLRRRIFAKVPARAPRERRVRPRGDAPVEGGAVRDAGLEAAPLAQILVDRVGRVAAANARARSLFGLDRRDVGRFLHDLELSYRPVDLPSRIRQAYDERRAVNLRDVEWHAPREIRSVDVEIAPLGSPAGEPLGVSISFADVTRYRRLQEALQKSKLDVEIARHELQSTIEELESTNEELQSANEELETTNEELQSANEELETMNRELQSTNVELGAINEELQLRTAELNELNTFLVSVLGSLSSAVVVVDTDLRVQAWNEAAHRLWGLKTSDAQGRHLLELGIGLPLDRLRAPVRAALAGDPPEEMVLDAVDRLGRNVHCRLSFAPLANGGTARGAILVMDLEP